MVATRIYKKLLPTFEAPTDSNRLALVNDNAKPIVVTKTMIQNNLLCKLNFFSSGKFCWKKGTNKSAAK